MASFIFYTILSYLLYRLIFNLIIPIFRTTRRIRRQFEQMQAGNAQPGFQQAPDPREQAPRQNAGPVHGGGEYIEFEEVK